MSYQDIIPETAPLLSNMFQLEGYKLDTSELTDDASVDIQVSTDASKFKFRGNITGLGVCLEFKRLQKYVKISKPLGREMTILQAETAAIGCAAQYLVNEGIRGKTIRIMSDCTDAIRQVSCMPTMEVALQANAALNQLGRWNTLCVGWVKAHAKNERNKMADQLAKNGADGADSITTESVPFSASYLSSTPPSSPARDTYFPSCAIPGYMHSTDAFESPPPSPPNSSGYFATNSLNPNCAEFVPAQYETNQPGWNVHAEPITMD